MARMRAGSTNEFFVRLFIDRLHGRTAGRAVRPYRSGGSMARQTKIVKEPLQGMHVSIIAGASQRDMLVCYAID